MTLYKSPWQRQINQDSKSKVICLLSWFTLDDMCSPVLDKQLSLFSFVALRVTGVWACSCCFLTYWKAHFTLQSSFMWKYSNIHKILKYLQKYLICSKIKLDFTGFLKSFIELVSSFLLILRARYTHAPVELIALVL